MKLKTMIFATSMALGLVACGGGNDTSNADKPSGPTPEKSQDCVKAGDLCKLENGKWVIHKKDKKPDPSPVGDSAMDYSDIGVTDQLKGEKRGFSFWHKGEKSPLNAKYFKKNPTQAPTVQWSSTLEYDQDLFNFVAVVLDTGTKDETKKPKFMFDKIGELNQVENVNNVFFGKGAHAPASAFTNGFAIGGSSLDYGATANTYAWNAIPAVVNTFMSRNDKGDWSLAKLSEKKKIFMNQEEDTGIDAEKAGTGSTKLRVYGVNAFLEYSDKTKVLDPEGKVISGAPTTYELPTRTSKKPYEHTNYVWYKLSNVSKRIQKTSVDSGGNLVKAIDKYKKDDDKFFPTDVEFDALQYTQFGRLTGEGVDPEADRIKGYADPLLKEYVFAPSKLAAAAGNKEGEDWYFARGTEPTPTSVLDNFKQAGSPVIYDGQAVMFGIDYDPRVTKPQNPNESKGSTNAVKPIDGFIKSTGLFDGKQNFVRLVWNPKSGDVTGSVYGVWTQASFWQAAVDHDDTGIKKGQAVKLKVDKGKVTFDNASGNGLTLSEYKDAKDKTHILEHFQVLNDQVALRIEPFIAPLVMLSGKVAEGTNSFGGAAIRVKDQSKGLFHGGFFGKDGSEIGGVINSQTGSFKNVDLADPAAKWGGSFGAKNHKTENEGDLIFNDAATDYSASFEFFNPLK